MNTKIDTTAIDNIIVGRVEPHIYAFSTQTIPNYLKVGDTYRPIEKRLDEWRTKFPELQREYSDIAKASSQVYFRDYEVHHFLINEAKRTRLNPKTFPNKPYSQEFFKNASVQDVKDAINDIRESYKKGISKYHYFKDGIPIEIHYNHKDDYPPRPNQSETIKRFKDAYRNGRTNLLMYAVMRFGKSFTSMCCAVEMDAKFVVVVSGKADVKAEWKKTVESHKKFIDYKYLTSNDLRYDDHILSNMLDKNKVVLFLTLQDLMGDNIKHKHKEVFKNNLDLLIIDETHFGARAKEYGKILTTKNVFTSKKQVQKELEDSDNTLEELNNHIKSLNAKVRIHLSGTPYRILLGNEFTSEDIIAFYQFSDIVRDQEAYDKKHFMDADYKEWDNPYYGFPQMIRFAFKPSDLVRKKMNEMIEKGITYTFSAIFKTCSITKDNSRNKLHCHFVYKQEILDLLQVIDGKKEDRNVLAFLDYDKIKSGNMCRHIVCVLPYRASCDALECLINENTNSFKNLSEYTIINISGWENSLYTSIESIQNKIRELENKNKKSLTLTVNKMLTGSTVPQWDTMIYFKDTSSPQEYDQAIYRLQNQYIKTYTDEKGNIIMKNMKPQTLLVDFDPNRMFRLQEMRSQFYNVNTDEHGNEKLRARLEYELSISPIIVINNDKMREVTPTNILDIIREYSKNKSVMDEAIEIPVDIGILDDPILKQEIENMSEIDSPKGVNFKPYDEEDEEDDFNLCRKRSLLGQENVLN